MVAFLGHFQRTKMVCGVISAYVEGAATTLADLTGNEYMPVSDIKIADSPVLFLNDKGHHKMLQTQKNL